MTTTEKTDTSRGVPKLPEERSLPLPTVGTFSPNFSFLPGLTLNRRPSAFTNVHDSRNVSNTASPVDIPARNLANSFQDVMPLMPALPPNLFADFSELPLPPGLAGLFQRRKRKENRPRRQRTTFSSEQTLKLELEYHRTEYITRPRRFELAEVLNLSETQIKIWFQNRRAKDKRIEKAQVDQQIRVMGIGPASPQYPITSHYSAFCGACYYKPSAVIGPATTLSRPFL